MKTRDKIFEFSKNTVAEESSSGTKSLSLFS